MFELFNLTTRTKLNEYEMFNLTIRTKSSEYGMYNQTTETKSEKYLYKTCIKLHMYKDYLTVNTCNVFILS